MSDGLLLIHAFPLDASMWGEQVRTISEATSSDVPVVAPNLPGFGGTPLEGDVSTMAVCARRCLRSLDDAGVDRAVVCGMSMGGYVALELWRSARDRVAGLVLANTRAEPDDEAGRERRRTIAETVRRDGIGVILESQRALLSTGAPRELWKNVSSIIRAQPAAAVAAGSLGMAERPDSRPDLPKIDVPTLVITSTEDELISPDLSRSMAEAIPGADLAVIEGAGHLSNLERPEEFDELLQRHILRCGLTG